MVNDLLVGVGFGVALLGVMVMILVDVWKKKSN